MNRIMAVLLVLGVTMSLDAPADTTANPRPDAAAAVQLVKAGAVLLDVRTEEEWQEGHVKDARHVPWQTLTASSSGLPKDKNTAIVTYCKSGARAQLAAQKLQGLGYTRAVAMTGGFKELAEAGMPVE